MMNQNNNKKNLMRAASLLLVASIAAGTLSACSSPSKEPVETNEATESETALDTVDYDSLSDLEKRALIKDSLPEKDYGGKAFRISTKSSFMYESKGGGRSCKDSESI